MFAVYEDKMCLCLYNVTVCWKTYRNVLLIATWNFNDEHQTLLYISTNNYCLHSYFKTINDSCIWIWNCVLRWTKNKKVSHDQIDGRILNFEFYMTSLFLNVCSAISGILLFEFNRLWYPTKFLMINNDNMLYNY